MTLIPGAGGRVSVKNGTEHLFVWPFPVELVIRVYGGPEPIGEFESFLLQSWTEQVPEFSESCPKMASPIEPGKIYIILVCVLSRIWELSTDSIYNCHPYCFSEICIPLKNKTTWVYGRPHLKLKCHCSLCNDASWRVNCIVLSGF